MADNKVESSKNTEIGEFKTPEELAVALEENSNERMAKRVREISGKVQDNSIDLRKKLQDELRPEEQLEIRETLPLSGIGKVLNKGLTKDEIESNAGKKVLSGVVGAETADMLEKGEGYFKNFGDAMNLAGKLFEEGKWIAAIGVFFKGLFGKFNLKAWEKKGEEKKEEGKDGEKDNENQLGNNDERIVGMVLSKIGGLKKGERESIPLILNNKNFSKLKFKEVENLNSNSGQKNNLDKELNLGGNFKDEDIKNAIKILIGKKELINDILKNSNPNWEELTLSEIFKLLHPSLSMLKNVEEIKRVEDIRDKFKFGEFEIPTNGGEKTFVGDCEVQYKELQKTYSGMNLNTLGLLKGTAKDLSYKSFSFENQNGVEKDDEKKFLGTVKEYGPKIEQTILNQFSLGLDFKKVFGNNPLKMGEIADLFIITGGKTEGFNDLEKAYIMLKITKLLDRRDDFMLGEYFGKIGEELANGSSVKIPKGVKDILSGVVGSMEDVIWEFVVGKSKVLAGIIKQNPAASLSIGVIIIGRIFLYKKQVSKVAIGAIITGIIGLLVSLNIPKDKIEQVKKDLENN